MHIVAADCRIWSSVVGGVWGSVRFVRRSANVWRLEISTTTCKPLLIARSSRCPCSDHGIEALVRSLITNQTVPKHSGLISSADAAEGDWDFRTGWRYRPRVGLRVPPQTHCGFYTAAACGKDEVVWR